MTGSLKRETTVATVVAVVEDLIQDWGLDLPDGVHAGVKLVADLDFASVDIIQLCVALEQVFARRLGFQSMLMRDGSYVSDLSVAQVAQFIDGQLTKVEGAVS